MLLCHISIHQNVVLVPSSDEFIESKWFALGNDPIMYSDNVSYQCCLSSRQPRSEQDCSFRAYKSSLSSGVNKNGRAKFCSLGWNENVSHWPSWYCRTSHNKILFRSTWCLKYKIDTIKKWMKKLHKYWKTTKTVKL